MVLSFITPYGGIEVVQDGETVEIDLQYLVDVIKKLAGLFRIERQSSVGTLPDGSYINRVSDSNGELTWPEYDWPLPVRQYGSIVNFTVFDGFSNSDTFIISWYHYTNNQKVRSKNNTLAIHLLFLVSSSSLSIRRILRTIFYNFYTPKGNFFLYLGKSCR